jgi:hypothetical protein
VAPETLADISTRVLTQFLTLDQALRLLNEFKIPARLNVWKNGKDQLKRHAKDCPGGKATCSIQLCHGHYFLGNYKDAQWLQELLDAGKLVPRTVSDAPRRLIKIPPIHAMPFDPAVCIRQWSRFVWDPNKREEVKCPRLFNNGDPLDKAAIWEKYTEFRNGCLEGTVAICGILKQIAKQNAKRDAAQDPDPRFRKQIIVLKDVGFHPGAWIDFDFNSFFPWAMTVCDPICGIPKWSKELEDYIWDHIHKPEI